MTTSQHNGREPLEASQQFAAKLLDDLPTEDDPLHNHHRIDDLHALVISEESLDTHRRGHLIIAGGRRQIHIVSSALQPTELSRVYDITYLEERDGLLRQHQQIPPWVCQDKHQTYRRGLDIYVDEERALGADEKSPFQRFYDRFRTWFENTTGNQAPDKTTVASMMPLEMTRQVSSDGATEKRVIWTDC